MQELRLEKLANDSEKHHRQFCHVIVTFTTVGGVGDTAPADQYQGKSKMRPVLVRIGRNKRGEAQPGQNKPRHQQIVTFDQGLPLKSRLMNTLFRIGVVNQTLITRRNAQNVGGAGHVKGDPRGHSNLIGNGDSVLTVPQTHELGIALDAIPLYFAPVYGTTDPFFYAMDTEFKFDEDGSGDENWNLYMKQARKFPSWQAGQ